MMYNSVVPFLDIAYKHVYAPDDTLTLTIQARALLRTGTRPTLNLLLLLLLRASV